MLHRRFIAWLLLLVFFVVACVPDSVTTAPTVVVVPSPAALPTATTFTSPVPPPPTATATSVPTATATPSPSATTMPTLTPTNVPPVNTPTTAPPATATIVTRPVPPPTAIPALQQVSAVCPAWFASPEPGKAVLLVENVINATVTVDGTAGMVTTFVVDRMQSNIPQRKLFQLLPGHYAFNFNHGSTQGNFSLDVQAGDLWDVTVNQGSGTKMPSRLSIPAGCPGNLSPAGQPTPAPSCPAWYRKPAAGQALLIIENNLGENTLEITNGLGITDHVLIPAKHENEPGRLVLDLAPGHQEFTARAGAGVVILAFDLAPNQSAIVPVSSPTVRVGAFGIRELNLAASVFSLLPPLGCPGFVPPTATPIAPVVCPSWYTRPEPGKGILVVENVTNRIWTLSALKGLTFDAPIPAMKGDAPGRILIQLAPGTYRFISLSVEFEFNLVAGQQIRVTLYFSGINLKNWPVEPLPTPAGC